MEENPAPKSETFMSASIGNLAAALSSFQGSMTQPKLEKDVTVKMKAGGTYSFKYADLSACVKAAAPHLKENKLSVSQIICAGRLITLLAHESGEWIKSELLLPAQTSAYQDFGSAITYLKRYSYCAILGIVADTDDDAGMASGNQTKRATDPEAELKQALHDLQNCKNIDEFNNLWTRLQYDSPALCQPGTKFYSEAAKKRGTLQY